MIGEGKDPALHRHLLLAKGLRKSLYFVGILVGQFFPLQFLNGFFSSFRHNFILLASICISSSFFFLETFYTNILCDDIFQLYI